MKRIRQLAKDSVVYGIGAVLAKSFSFFLLPIYTRIFTPADYGTIEMLSVIASLLAAVLTMGMDSAQSFYFFENKDAGKAEQAKLVTAILQWRLTWGFAIVVTATLAAPLFNTYFFEGMLTWEYFAIAFVGTLLAQLMSQSVEIFRLLYRPWPYVMITLAQTILAAAMILTLVLVLDKGVLGYFLGASLASAIAASLGWYFVRDYVDFRSIQSAWWPRLLSFGAPLLPAGIAMYVMNTTDRWFVQHYHGAAALGIYSVGAKFALIMALAIEIFRKAWWPIAMDAMHSEDGADTFRTIARMFMGLGVAAIIYLSFLSPWLVQWMAGPAFESAWVIVGVLAWQSLFYGFYLVASAGLWKQKKTYYSTYLMAGAALMNIGLNWWLVPKLASIGAAMATALSYLLLVVLSMAVSERLWKVGFEKLVMTTQIAIGVAAVAWMSLAAGRSWLTAITIHLIVMALLISMFDKKLWVAFKKKAAENA